jgi:hypothetical protein
MEGRKITTILFFQLIGKIQTRISWGFWGYMASLMLVRYLKALARPPPPPPCSMSCRQPTPAGLTAGWGLVTRLQGDFIVTKISYLLCSRLEGIQYGALMGT